MELGRGGSQLFSNSVVDFNGTIDQSSIEFLDSIGETGLEEALHN